MYSTSAWRVGAAAVLTRLTSYCLNPQGELMLNIGRRDGNVDPKAPVKPVTTPPYSNPGALATAPAPGTVRPTPPMVNPTRDMPLPTTATRDPAPAPVPNEGETPGSKLFIGVNIKLKGVEISDCDVLVVEGHVEATVNSKAMEISGPGTFKGT